MRDSPRGDSARAPLVEGSTRAKLPEEPNHRTPRASLVIAIVSDPLSKARRLEVEPSVVPRDGLRHGRSLFPANSIEPEVSRRSRRTEGRHAPSRGRRAVDRRNREEWSGTHTGNTIVRSVSGRDAPRLFTPVVKRDEKRTSGMGVAGYRPDGSENSVPRNETVSSSLEPSAESTCLSIIRGRNSRERRENRFSARSDALPSTEVRRPSRARSRVRSVYDDSQRVSIPTRIVSDFTTTRIGRTRRWRNGGECDSPPFRRQTRPVSSGLTVYADVERGVCTSTRASTSVLPYRRLDLHLRLRSRVTSPEAVSVRSNPRGASVERSIGRVSGL